MFHISSQRELFLGVAEGDFCQLWKRNGLSVSESCTAESLLLSYIKMLCSSPLSVKNGTTFWLCAMPLGIKEAHGFGVGLSGAMENTEKNRDLLPFSHCIFG